jgi:hypothetical protein
MLCISHHRVGNRTVAISSICIVQTLYKSAICGFIVALECFTSLPPSRINTRASLIVVSLSKNVLRDESDQGRDGVGKPLLSLAVTGEI